MILSKQFCYNAVRKILNRNPVMQTIKIQLEDTMYQNIVQSGVDIQAKFKEFLIEFVDDGYPAITTEEAQARVSKAVENYKNGTGTYMNDNEYQVHRNNHLKNLQAQYANH